VRRVWVTLLMVACVTVAGCAQPTSPPKGRQSEAQWGQVRSRIKLQLARRSLEQGLIEEAMQQCNEALSLDVESLDGLLLMAQVCLEKGNDGQAEAALKHAALINEKHPDISYLGGILAERRGRLDEAIDLYQKASTTNPADLDYLISCAMALLHAGQPERALPLLKSRQKDFSEEAAVHLLMGQALSLMDRREEASASLHEAVRLAPDDLLIRQEAGLALLDAGKIEPAMEVLAPLWIAAGDKCSPVVIRMVAGKLLAGGHCDRAIRVLEPATAICGKDTALSMLLARAYLSADRPADAVRAAARAVQNDESSVEARLLLAYCSLAAGQKQEAAQVARQILARHPRDADAVAILAKTK
jgi:tetratricopeptide (TPR) repeat protein